MAGIATYVYCIVQRSTRPRVTRGPSGLGGASLPRLVDIEKGLWMVCADVPLPNYGTESIERGLRDLDWVSRVAVAHEAVVERFARVAGATVIPMKLFTIFSSDERAHEAMRERRRDLGSILKRIKGCQEWGVRITRGAHTITTAKGKGLDVRVGVPRREEACARRRARTVSADCSSGRRRLARSRQARARDQAA